MNEQKTYVQAALAELKLACHPAMVPQVAALQKELDKELDQLRQRVAEAERERDEAWLQAATWRDRANQAKELLGMREQAYEAKLALAEQDARRWRDRWVDYRTAHWRATQPYKQARFLAESEAIDIENKLQEARDLRAAIDASGEMT